MAVIMIADGEMDDITSVRGRCASGLSSQSNLVFGPRGRVPCHFIIWFMSCLYYISKHLHGSQHWKAASWCPWHNRTCNKEKNGIWLEDLEKINWCCGQSNHHLWTCRSQCKQWAVWHSECVYRFTLETINSNKACKQPPRHHLTVKQPLLNVCTM